MTFYHIGFDMDDGFSGIASSCKLSAAKKLAKEIEEEYGEKPTIRKENQNEVSKKSLLCTL